MNPSSDNPRMETTDKTPPAAALFDPLAGWQAASRMNAAAFQWMASGFQQWMALLTTWPNAMATPLQTWAEDVRTARVAKALDAQLRIATAPAEVEKSERAFARGEPRRSASRAKPKPVAASRKRRARG